MLLVRVDLRTTDLHFDISDLDGAIDLNDGAEPNKLKYRDSALEVIYKVVAYSVQILERYERLYR